MNVHYSHGPDMQCAHQAELTRTRYRQITLYIQNFFCVHEQLSADPDEVVIDSSWDRKPTNEHLYEHPYDATRDNSSGKH